MTLAKRADKGSTGSGGSAEADGSANAPPGLIAGYIRVSTPSQDHAYQRAAIEQAARARGEHVDRWFADVASGGTMDRPQLERMRRQLAARTIGRVWVWRLDRLGRTGIGPTLDCVAQIRRSGATLASVADGFALEDGPGAELVLCVLAWAAQLQRQQIRENQDAARARMAEQGRGWGRPGLPPPTVDAARALLSQGKDRGAIARELQISRSAVDKIARSKKRHF